MTAPAEIAVFRFDAGPEIGGGHAMRCLTLAEAMIQAGWRCRFAIRAGTMETVHRLAAYAADCIELSGEPGDEPAEIASALAGERCRLLVADHYGRDAAFETPCRVFADAVMVIDDLADREHDADLLLDQNLGRRAGDYADLVPETCRRLMGPEYALLRPDFAALRGNALVRRRAAEGVERILVSFGMADPHGLTLRALAALGAAGYAGQVDAVIGGGAPDIADVHALAAEMGPQVRVLSDVEDMATLMADADLAIGAGGTTSWERCALGLPALVLIVADNQIPIAEALADAGAAWVLGDLTIAEGTLRAAIADILADERAVMAGAMAAAEICDGDGCRRVLEALYDD